MNCKQGKWIFKYILPATECTHWWSSKTVLCQTKLWLMTIKPYWDHVKWTLANPGWHRENIYQPNKIMSTTIRDKYKINKRMNALILSIESMWATKRRSAEQQCQCYNVTYPSIWIVKNWDRNQYVRLAKRWRAPARKRISVGMTCQYDHT